MDDKQKQKQKKKKHASAWDLDGFVMYGLICFSLSFLLFFSGRRNPGLHCLRGFWLSFIRRRRGGV
jgi:hypothetical protein